MKKASVSIFACALALMSASCSTAETNSEKHPKFAEVISAQTFFKGNIHTHTTESDGNLPPAAVAQWFHKKGYNFLALTDHDKLTDARIPPAHDFILINGVELTGLAERKTPIHVNALCGHKALVGLRAEKPARDILNQNIALSHGDGAVTLVNHPNFGWALTGDDLLASDGFELLEIASAHPEVHPAGDSTHPSEEELWDSYMSKKHRIFGAAVDDSHNYKKFGDKESNPGLAWIQAWAPALNNSMICEALRQGHFYSSTGTKITALVVTPKTLEIKMDNWQPSTDHVDFIGINGQLLDRSVSNPAIYTIKGGEGYVRAHVFQEAGEHHKGRREAWTQAYFIKYE